jgi:hypothetical protein
MSDDQQQNLGTIGWVDLTVDRAEQVRDFYREVVGWEAEEHDMGGYSDFVLKTPGDGTPVAGVCHAKGTNAGLPPQWLIYVSIRDLDASVSKCVELGGAILVEPKDAGGYGRMCVIKDPAGAVMALLEPLNAT